jgi:preprotein translocase subunit SecA
MFTNIIGRLTNNNNYKLSSVRRILDKVNDFEEKISKLKNEELTEILDTYKKELRSSDIKSEEIQKRLDYILPEVYAVIREASKRVMNQRHRDVQIIAGIVLHQGKVAEQKTGEGKTLTATLPLILNALPGRGTHLVTPNDYLSKHAAGWYGPLYDLLGMKVGVVIDHAAFVYDKEYVLPDYIDEYTKHLKPATTKEAYAADITYATASTLGFDYLRDNMVVSKDRIMQTCPIGELGVHNFAIVDEVDSILIDIARTPLIISDRQKNMDAQSYFNFAKMADGLVSKTDYTTDEKDKVITLTELGINKIERKLGVQNLYEKDFETVHKVENAIKAKEFYIKDKDYLVRQGQVLIIDQNTGRVLEGNRWSKGLHQAIEAKEGLEIKPENETVATISYQNYFRLYSKLAGMTGTAITEAEEFFKIYSLDVVVIPTHKAVSRIDKPDIVYKTETGKYKAIAKDIAERNKTGQPVLIGTISVEKSELLSKYLKRLGIKHEILNAKQHEREAMIIMQAGQKGSVTVATNMAGRGVDIILGGDPFDQAKHDEIISLGGLYVLGTERHDSRRIDNQLRGRSGRQGELGESRFYLSLQDDLMRIFGGQTIENIMSRLGLTDDIPIEAGIISKSIENSQKKVESINFDRRRSLVEYDDVINVQREIVYKLRKRILFAEIENKEAFYEWLKGKLGSNLENFDELFEKKEKKNTPQVWFDVVKRVSLEVIDSLWMDHIDTMDDLRSDVSLRGYAQTDPVVEYKREGKQLFDLLISEMMANIADRLKNVEVQIVKEQKPTPIVEPESLKQNNEEDTTKTEEKKIGRNELCYCGSGKKYKHCHGKGK